MKTPSLVALAGQGDGGLLRLFAAGGPQAGCAFEALLRRHGPMVWRACRAWLRDGHAAEDAFQATFPVRRAGALALRGSLGRGCSASPAGSAPAPGLRVAGV